VRVCAQLQRNQRTVYRGDKCFEQNLQGNMKHILCRVNFLRQSSYVFKKTKKNTDFLDCVRDSKTVRMILTSFQFVLEALGPRIVCVYSVWKHGKKVRKQQRKCARIAMLWSQVLFYSPRDQDKVSDRLYEICSILIMYWISLHPVLWNRYHAIRRYRISGFKVEIWQFTMMNKCLSDHTVTFR
jgi:hypothetical protein